MADTLADWNNNPGNLRPQKGVTYEGQIGVDGRGFAIFENKDFGKKALVSDVSAKMAKGLNTPEAFINRYAPAGDNDEDARDNYKIHMAEALGLTSTHQPFPENSHEKIADAISRFEGSQSPAATEAPALAATEVTPPVIAPGTPMTAPAQGEHVLSPQALSVIGGGVGATVGAGVTAARKSAGLIKDIYGRAFPDATGAVPAVEAISEIAPGVADTSPGGKWRAKTGYGKGTGTVNDVVLAGRRATPSGPVSSKQANLFGIPQAGEPTALMDRLMQQGQARDAANATANAAAKAAAEAAAMPESTLNRLSRYWGKVAPVVAPVAKIGVSALGGALGANEIYNAELDRQKHGLTARNAIDYASGAGGLLATIPTVPTQVAGGLLQLPAAAMSAKDWIERNPEKAAAMYNSLKSTLSNPQSYRYPDEAGM